VALAPLRAGSGTRLKILEAFALGVPVVSTGLGHEGLEVTPGEHLLSADDAETFVAAVERLLADADLRRHLARQARRLVEIRYDWEIIVAQHEQLYQALCAAC
jgi:glycosyltransferase involved in cell wall biosynthesis